MLHAPLLALSLTCSLVFSFGNPGGVFAGPLTASSVGESPALLVAPARGSVDVDTSSVGEEGPALKKRLDSRAGDILLANEVLPAKHPGDARVFVKVRPAGDDQPGWLAIVSVERDGASITDATREIDCKLCTEGELVDQVGAALEELIPAHATAREAEGPAGPQGPEGPAGPAGPAGPPDKGGQKDKKIGPMGFAGIGVAALGAVGIGVGAGLLTKDPVVSADNPADQKEYKKPGAAILAVGGVALVTGVALIVVDQIKRKKGSGTAARSNLGPYFGPDGAGLAFATRF